ncbi:MAG: RNA methyltransferase [Lachnospiraceae bacterium]|nr:RNA methyltransferase [Lachnospiraceae bacterium]
MISSSSNAKVKQIIRWRDRAGERRRDGVFIAEGIKMLEEAPEEDILEVYVSESALNRIAEKNEAVADKLKGHSFAAVKDDIFARMSDTCTPQGIITVMRRREYEAEDMLCAGDPLLLVLESLQDPGNLGTIIRTAEGAGVSGVIMNPQTVDIYNPKTIRATMGSIYRVPFAYADNLCELIAKCRKKGIHTYAAHLDGKNCYCEHSFSGPTAFIIGNEGNGLTGELADSADTFIRIPMEGRVESLNAAVAAALLMYEAHRQRSL